MSQKIIVLGHSCATVAFVESYRQENQEDLITLFPCDGRLPYYRSKLLDVFAKELKPKDIFIRPERWYKDHKVEVILDEDITRINVARKRVYTSAKQQFEYDHLFFNDVPVVQPTEIKGHRKSGIFALDRWTSVDSMLQYLAFVDTVIIQAETFDAIKAAFLLLQQGKEVVLVFAANNLFDHFDEETAKMLKQILEERGLRVIDGEIITEALGESELKAVRLLGGKIVAAEMVLFEQSVPDMRIFSDDSIVSSRQVSVALHSLKADFDGLWAADYIACTAEGSLPLNEADLMYQGEVVAQGILNKESFYSKKEEVVSNIVLGSFSCAWMGETKLMEGGAEFSNFDSQSDAFRKIYLFNGVVVGAVLINDQVCIQKIRDIIDRGIDVKGVESFVLESNFSINDLIKMREQQAAEPA